MGMVVRTNTMALNAYRQLGMNNSAVSKSLEKLSSGFRINRAGDDAAGLAISEKMKAQITGLETASANAQDGISLIQTAEGNLSEVHDMLNRMVELATKSANGTYTSTERDALQAEVDQLLEEIDRISQSANFNGTKLLNGDLAAKAVADKVTVGGSATAATSKSAATTGTFTQNYVLKLTDLVKDGSEAKIDIGDKFSYTVALNDGTSHTVEYTWAAGKDGAKDLKDAEGNTILSVEKGAAAGTVTLTQLTNIIKSDLEKTAVGDKFTITAKTDGQLEFVTNEAGSKDAIKGLSWNATIQGVNLAANTTLTATPILDFQENEALMDGIEIDADKLIEYDGTNYEDAVFTINGHKFVLLTELHDATAPGADPNDASMQVTKGLGSDVTILVGGTEGLKNPAVAANTQPENDYFADNIAKIAEVTGLKVTDAVNESKFGAAGDTGVAAGAGIRLSLGDAGATGGLVLQIGDTADDYNKLRVSIEDMSAEGLGLKDLDITTEDSASAAIDKIKAAINTVSTTRAGMGALQNRLEHTINNLDVAVENLSSANSRIRDTDMAKEMMNYTKMNVLVQSAQAMLAQANQQPQSVLQLLQ